MQNKPKILVVSYNIPHPDRSSGELRFFSILELLTEFWQLDFCIAPSNAKWNNFNEQKLYIEQLEAIGINVLLLNENTFIKAIKKNNYAGGYFNLYWIAEETMYLFKKIRPNSFTIVDSVDVHFAREESQLKLGKIDISKVFDTKKRELNVYKSADITIAVSKDDFNLLSEIEGIKNVFLIPNIVKICKRKYGIREPIVLFIGSYTWYPNPDAVIWFVESIWPIILESIPNAQFYIIGSDPTEEIKNLNSIQGVNVIGYVSDTKPYFESAALSIAPMRIGGGMKGKVNEALAHGIPVVATHIGAQGFEAIHGKHMMIADEVNEFAECVTTLLQNNNLQEEMGLAGQELNSKICSQEAVKKNIIELVNYCSKRYTNEKKKIILVWCISNTIVITNKILKLKNKIKKSTIEKKIKSIFQKSKSTDIGNQNNKTIKFSIYKPTELIEFPKINNIPIVSIIIPVYNQWEYTHSCLYSILKNSENIQYEIIIADDNSTDDTKNIDKFVKNIKVIRNENNLGFLLNCNNAAKYAKGKYILFLNNDTIVQKDWLKWLIKPMEESDKIGLVGSKLIFSTGQLQEAGGIVFKDGSAMNYGREDVPDKSEYNYLKDVDYCSGACICVRKEIWDKLNGFDTQYSPAYYEDTDLAMQIRTLDYRIIYQPKSVIIHFEGISNGTDLAAGIKNMQQKNQMVFYEKWKIDLKKNNYSRYENLFKARDRSKYKQTILIFDYEVPSSSEHIEKIFNIINYFSKKEHIIKFIPDNFLKLEPFVSEIEQNGVEVLYGEWYKENYLQWITENAENIDSIYFIDEVLLKKYSKKISNLPKKRFKISLINHLF